MVTGDELLVKAQVRQCRRCPLWNKEMGPVPFSNPVTADLLNLPIRAVQGEAPGQIENAEGKPFVGPAGQLLRDFLPNPESYYYLNTVCCWPRHTPTRKESDACKPNLVSQLDVIRPLFLLILGTVALQAWWPNLNISSIRGKWFEIPYGSVDKCWAMATWHPAYILRKRGSEDEGIWKEDLRWFNEISVKGVTPALADDMSMIETRELKKAPTAGMLQGPQLELDITPS